MPVDSAGGSVLAVCGSRGYHTEHTNRAGASTAHVCTVLRCCYSTLSATFVGAILRGTGCVAALQQHEQAVVLLICSRCRGIVAAQNPDVGVQIAWSPDLVP